MYDNDNNDHTRQLISLGRSAWPDDDITDKYIKSVKWMKIGFQGPGNI